MEYLGTQISTDGCTVWRNNGGVVERTSTYSSHGWEEVASPCPTTQAELEEFCREGGFEYLPPNATRTIPQKMSGTGSVHDVASDLFDREIVFAPGCIYAVILAAYYGGKGYSTHRTPLATIAASRKVKDYSHIIVDIQGNRLEPDWEGNLVELPEYGGPVFG